MKQIFRALVVAVLLAMAGSVSALGLGKLEQDSSLNERFEGRIFLLSATPDELASLQVRLADEPAFRRAGIDYAPVLRDLKFKLVEPESGPDYIHVTSSQPVREPFLNFLVELNWSSGRLFREYTVLLDPPMYEPDQGRMAAPSRTTAPAPAEETTAAAPSRSGHPVIIPRMSRPGPARSAYTPSYSGGDYGPVQSGETLWSIANGMKPAAVTTHQMMLALLRVNPDAFIGNNINGLKRGAILRMPDADEMEAMSQAEALAQVRSQHGLWESARQSVAADPATRAETASPAPVDSAEELASETPAAEAAETESRLELVGAEQGAAAQTGDAEGDSTDLSQQLAVANEKLQSINQENAELRDRLAENEALIEDLKRLIALKDDELASLQDRTAEEAAAVEPAAPAPQQIDGVEYPNGDPGQFIGEVPPLDELRPGPVPAAAEISHTVNRPEAARQLMPERRKRPHRNPPPRRSRRNPRHRGPMMARPLATPPRLWPEAVSWAWSWGWSAVPGISYSII
ncbi:MAG: FimV/HubP family polar landmark protein [Gammaproteobacteria bacterium]|nr:FimV/HubP family polar landmark protein [Gammaproteobacteria bacterium]